MSGANKLVSSIRRHEEDLFLAILLLVSLSFLVKGFLSLEGLNRIFPMLFSVILSVSIVSLFGFRYLTGRSSTGVADPADTDYYPIVLIVLTIVFLIVGWVINLAVGAIVFVLLYALTRPIGRRKTGVLLTITLAIIYVFVELINAPIL